MANPKESHRYPAETKRLETVPFCPELDVNILDKVPVEELPTKNGLADYALFVGGKLLGIIEARIRAGDVSDSELLPGYWGFANA